MKYLVIILSILLLSGCNAKRWCSKRFPPETKTEIKIVEKEVIRDTTVYVYLQADTVFQKDTITVYETPDGYQTTLSMLDLEYSYSTAQVINGRLDHKLFQKETLIEQTIKNAIKENSTHTVIETTEVREVVKDNFWTRLYRIYFWSTIALIAGYVAAKIKRII